MSAAFDHVTASLHVNVSSVEFDGFRADMRTRTPSASTRRLFSVMTHERAHFFSFFGSTLADFHRSMAIAQIANLNFFLIDTIISPKTIEVPILPRGIPEHSSQEFGLKINEGLNKVRDLYFGFIDNQSGERVAFAQHFAHNVLCPDPKPREGPPLDFAGCARLFIDEPTAELVSAHSGRAVYGPDKSLSEEMPCIPSGSDFGLPGTALQSASVWEASAIISEILSADDRIYGSSLRASIPPIYQTALRYALHALNVSVGKDYTYEDLLANCLPLPLMLTIAGMIELALHPTGFFSTQYSTAQCIAGMCPAWRLYLVANTMMEHRLKPMEDVTSDDPNGDYHDWQDYVGEFLNWGPWELPGVMAATSLREKRDPYEKLCSLGKVLRVLDCLRYIQQKAYVRDEERFDYLSIRLTDAVLTPSGDRADSEFARSWADLFYGTAAICVGDHWDFWLEEYHNTRGGEAARKVVARGLAELADGVDYIGRGEFDSFVDQTFARTAIRPDYAG